MASGHRSKKLTYLSCLALGMIFLAGSSSRAEEGMWTFDNLPSEALSKKYNFTPAQEWLDHLQASSVRFMDGGSGSFVSPFGLVVTNHHVAIGQLQKMSTAKKDYVKDGFYAKEPKDEIKCPDLELNVLVSTQDVTAKVLAVVKKGMSEEAALKARKAERARLEKEAKQKTGLQSDIVSLYHGGEYWMYAYKKYTDVRLVMAPERQAAFFGGDSDNFTYPRYDLDMAFFRVYENDKPLRNEHHLKWSTNGAARGELVFVTGHPGKTDRLFTVAQLAFQRDIVFPLTLGFIDRTIAALHEYAKLGTEPKRRALTRIFGFSNAKKAYDGMFLSLNDEQFMELRSKAEKEFRIKIASKPEWKKAYAGAWERIENVLKKHGTEIRRRVYLRILGSNLANKAITIVKLVHEVKKSDADRLDGYHDSELERLKFRLFSPAPIYPDLEAVNLETGFRLSLDKLGKNDSFAKILLELGDPKAASEKLTKATKLGDPEFRKKLVEGGVAAVEKSDDPMIVLARKIVPIIVENEKWQKKHIESVFTPANERIAKARFAIHGKNAYPDATFSLRITFGTVRGYPMNGTRAPFQTTLYGLYDRALGFENQGDWLLPERFWQRKNKLKLSTPVNFVSDCDIIGGNSGSPVLNTKGEFVGLVFDGNIESLAGRFFFDQSVNRTVSVHSSYIIEALRKLYDANDLADEIVTPN
ncbi:MAG: S46 family peptidase [Deltaproteobacteria bacterium]|nr:S46 family peptidase [Deltaproteobacteria bacterium]